MRADQGARRLRARTYCGSRSGCRDATAGCHGLRVNHLGAEIRQLHRLVVRQRIDGGRIRHPARVGRQHTVDVGPDVNFRGIKQRAEN